MVTVEGRPSDSPITTAPAPASAATAYSSARSTVGTSLIRTSRAIPEIERSVFVIPPEAFKAKRPHVVVLNDVAWSIIEAQRSLHPIWVFPYCGRRINTMNNNGWQNARRAVGLPLVRVHDLRHSFGCRLRAAGVSAEDREALLGHSNHSMAGHYASADVGHLLKQANLLLNRRGTRTLLRVAYH